MLVQDAVVQMIWVWGFLLWDLKKDWSAALRDSWPQWDGKTQKQSPHKLSANQCFIASMLANCRLTLHFSRQRAIGTSHWSCSHPSDECMINIYLPSQPTPEKNLGVFGSVNVRLSLLVCCLLCLHCIELCRGRGYTWLVWACLWAMAPIILHGRTGCEWLD